MPGSRRSSPRKTTPENRSEQEIAGYRDVLALIHTNRADILFQPRYVEQLHGMLHRYVGDRDAGHWKKLDNEVEEERLDGTKVVRFTPVSAALTPQAMQDLHTEFQRALDAGTYAPLLLCAAYVLDFTVIHPFRDGNGRMSRLITLWLTSFGCRSPHENAHSLTLEAHRGAALATPRAIEHDTGRRAAPAANIHWCSPPSRNHPSWRSPRNAHHLPSTRNAGVHGHRSRWAWRSSRPWPHSASSCCTDAPPPRKPQAPRSRWPSSTRRRPPGRLKQAVRRARNAAPPGSRRARALAIMRDRSPGRSRDRAGQRGQTG